MLPALPVPFATCTREDRTGRCRAAVLAFMLACSAPCLAQPASATAAADAAIQLEADYRVIAARCGTPAFEKYFYRQSKAAVAAGLIPGGKDVAVTEKSIESHRRNPSVLVPNRAACDDKVALLKEVQKQRAGLVGRQRAR